MSVSIPQHIVQAYGAGVDLVSQQMGSRLRRAVTVDAGVVGERKYYNRLGVVTASTPTGRHSDSPLVDAGESRRAVDLIPKEIGNMIDDFDQAMLLSDPTNDYVMQHGAALGRAIDTEIIRAAEGTAVTGKSGGGTATLPAGQIVDSGGASALTFAKVRQARRILMKNEALRDRDPLYYVIGAQQVDDLLGTTEATSSDFVNLKALAEGEIRTWMGGTWIQTEILTLDTTSNHRQCLVFPKSAIKLAIGRDVRHEVGPRPDKRFDIYAYSRMLVGAVRMEEEKVVRIDCLES